MQTNGLSPEESEVIQKILSNPVESGRVVNYLLEFPGGVRDIYTELVRSISGNFNMPCEGVFRQYVKRLAYFYLYSVPGPEMNNWLKGSIPDKVVLDEKRTKKVVLPLVSMYTRKDQEKSDKANKFIGRGSIGSSTQVYADAWGNMANCGSYQIGDRVFVSVEGARVGRKHLDRDEIFKAIRAGVMFLTDPPWHRSRDFNVGERELAGMLMGNHYYEHSPGEWLPVLTPIEGEVV